MRIGIDAREAFVDQPGGLRSYAESVVDCLAANDGDDELVFYTDREVSTDGAARAAVHLRVCPPAQLAVREQFSLPRMLRADGVELCHFLANTAPLRCPAPYVLTLHDTFCMRRPLGDVARQGSLRNKGLSLYSKLVPYWAARRARRLVTVSAYSAQQIAQLLRTEVSDVAIVPQAVHPRFRVMCADSLRSEIAERLGVSRFALVLGSAEPRKNLARALEAFRRVAEPRKDLGLVMTWPVRSDMASWVRATVRKLPERVHVMEHADDATLVALYNAAEFLVFASLDEGFGLPVVEAMACGCPVITSDASCLPDTAGGAALLADPTDTQDIADKMATLADDAQLRASLREAGLARVEAFAPFRAREALLKLYDDCLSRGLRQGGGRR